MYYVPNSTIGHNPSRRSYPLVQSYQNNNTWNYILLHVIIVLLNRWYKKYFQIHFFSNRKTVIWSQRTKMGHGPQACLIKCLIHNTHNGIRIIEVFWSPRSPQYCWICVYDWNVICDFFALFCVSDNQRSVVCYGRVLLNYHSQQRYSVSHW